jgi:hypothetical protein
MQRPPSGLCEVAYFADNDKPMMFKHLNRLTLDIKKRNALGALR